jgi:CheY-like chemotaxis protein
VTRILLVEDNSADAMLLQEAFKVAEVTSPVDHVTDGEQALAHLRSVETPPALMLLDLNLPRKDGREVLAEVKADPALRDIPVIVLTTSSAPKDVALAYEHGANAFVRKPLGMDRLIDAAASIRDFWLTTATLPSEA